MGRFVSATGQFLMATYGQFSCPPTGTFKCPLTLQELQMPEFAVTGLRQPSIEGVEHAGQLQGLQSSAQARIVNSHNSFPSCECSCSRLRMRRSLQVVRRCVPC